MAKFVHELISDERWTQKQMLEGTHVRAFMLQIDNLAQAELFAVRPDPPDFVVKKGVSQLAIEHTRIFVQSPSGVRTMRGEEEERDRLVKLASQKYDGLGGIPVSVAFQWHTNHRLNRKNFARDAGRIVRIVRGTVPTDGTSVCATIRCLQLPSFDRPRGVVEIFVDRFKSQTSSSWAAQGGGWHTPLLWEHTQAAISAKNKRRSVYAAKWPQAWLLIVIEYDKPSSFLSLNDDVCGKEYESAFDRTYIWRDVDRQCLRLKTRRRGDRIRGRS